MINNTYKKANCLLHAILLLLTVQLGWTQIYPVQVNSNVIPPYLSSVSKYSTTTDQKYLVNIFTNDLSVVNRQVKLKLYIQGNGINAQSAPVVAGASPLFINGGESVQLNNLDLAPYFQLQNLQGINPQQYSGVLPQGNYNFCVEVYDFITNQPISQKSCTFFYFIYNEPPLLNLPFNHDIIHFQDPQNIIFTWTPRHINATNIEYEFTLVELLDNQAPSNYAFIVGAPVWQETLNNTILNYNFTLPQLTAGRKYAWRVKAVNQPGFGEDAVFNNNGYSEIYDFIYAGNCNVPEFVLAQSTSATQAKVMWQSNPNHLANVVKYRKSGTQEWFNAAVANGQALLLDLEPSATYEFEVGGTCLGDITSFSAINQFTQPAKNVVAINCGIAPTIDLTNVTLYNEELQKDMVFMAADYAVHINESQGVGTYTGKGWTRSPFFKNIKIAVEFENIKLNSELQLVQGEVKARYDPAWSNILDINDVIDEVDDILDPLQASNDVHNHQVNFVIIDTTNITVQNGQIIITTPEGTTGAIFDFDQGENTTITDVNGTVYNVDPNGNVTLGQQGIGIATSSNTENINSDGKVTALSDTGARVIFNRSSKSVAFDDSSANYTNLPAKLASKYKTIKDSNGNDYPFYYKAVVNKENGKKTVDYVTAEITITDTLVKAKDIIFNLNGLKVTAVDSITNGNVIIKTLEIPVFTTVGEPELLALIKNGTEKQSVIGAMTVIPIKDVGTVNVSLVPVNGATVSQDDINEAQNIYRGAGVTLNITTLPAYEDRSITTLECGTSGFIANYTSAQNAFIDRYKAGKTVSGTEYYLFVTKDITPSRPLSGFMPLHRQFGFIFTGQTTSGTGEIKETSGTGLATVIAHELGHGVFELEHPWEKFDYTKASFTTNWLMDYANGKKLPYLHWQQISHPKTALYLFQSDSSGELGKGYGLTPDFTFVSTNTNTISFIKNAGEGFLGGFVYNNNTKEENYIWDSLLRKYFVYGNTNEYKGDIKTTLNDSDIVYLIFDKTKNCPENKFLRTLYVNIKNIKDAAGLESYINANKNKVFATSPDVYVNNIDCTPAIKAQEGSVTGNIVDVNDQNIKIIRDCGTDAYTQKAVFTGDNNVTTWGEVVVKYLNYNIDVNKKNKFGDNLSGLILDGLKYINPSQNYRGDLIFAPVYIEELNNKLAYLEASSGIQLHINFIETTCTFTQIEGNNFARDIFISSNISKTKGIYVLIVKNRNSQNVLEWKTYFAFGTDISSNIKTQAENLLTINISDKFKTFGQSLIQFYKKVPKKQIQYVYVIEKATPIEIAQANADTHKRKLTKNIYGKIDTVENAEGNAIQTYFILKDTQTNTYSTNPLGLDIAHDLKEQYVSEYGLALAKRVATEKFETESAGWSYKYDTFGPKGETIHNDDTPTILKCRFSFNQTCNSYYIDTAFLVAGIATIPFGNVAILVDGVAIIYYATNGQTDMAVMYLAGYALGPIIGQTIKGIAVVAPKVIKFTNKLYLESRLVLQLERGLTESGVRTLLTKELNTGVKEFLLPHGTYGNAFVKATDNEIIAGYIKTEQNVDKLVIFADKKGAHSLTGKLSTATDAEVREAFELLHKAGNWVAQRNSFWDDWINKCFPGKNWSTTTFVTKGKNYNTFKTTNTSIYNDMKALNSNEIKLQEFIEAGSTIPTKVLIDQGDEFFKIVPKGNNIGSPSAYYVDQAQLNLIKANSENLEQVLGLPLGSVNAEYDVFKITFQGNSGYVFKSTVAGTEQFANATPALKYITPGGGIQTLILDNMDGAKWIKGSAPIESIIPNKLPLIGN